MISGKNLLLNIPPQTTSNASSSASSPDDILALMLNGSEAKKEEGTDPNAVDPSSFVLLLSQLVNLPQDAAANETDLATTPEDVKAALISELAGAPTQPQTDALAVEDIVEPTDPALLAQQADAENPALNWLESENFQALKADPALAKNLAADDSDSALDLQTQSDAKNAKNANANLLSPQQAVSPDIEQAAASESATIATKSVADKNSASLQTPSLNLDPVSAAIKSTTPDSQTDVDVNNLIPTMPVITNQPGHTQIASQHKVLDIPVPLTHPQWGDQFADHIAWLGKNDIKGAVIKITPEELGPIEISIKVAKDNASVNIISHSAQARDIVEQAIPKLRDMMNTQGLNLADVQVNVDERSGNAFAQNNNKQDQQENDSRVFYEGDEEVQMVSTIKKPPKGLVDYFA